MEIRRTAERFCSRSFFLSVLWVALFSLLYLVELSTANVRICRFLSPAAVVMSMEECFQITSEEQCFFYQNRYNDGCSAVSTL